MCESLFSSYVLALNELSYKKRKRKPLMKLTPVRKIVEKKRRFFCRNNFSQFAVDRNKKRKES